jgi:hypothetical protein
MPLLWILHGAAHLLSRALHHRLRPSRAPPTIRHNTTLTHGFQLLRTDLLAVETRV